MKSTSYLLFLGLASSAIAEPIPFRRQYPRQDDCTDEVTANPVPGTATVPSIPYGTGASYGPGGPQSSSEASPEQGSSSSASLLPSYTGSYSYGIPSSSEASPVTPSAGPSGSYPVYGNGSSSQPTAGPGTGIPGTGVSRITSTIPLTTTITLPGSPSGGYPTGSPSASPETTGNQTSPASPTGTVPIPYSSDHGTAVSPVTPSSNSTLPQPTSPAQPSSYPHYSYGTGGPSSSSTNEASPGTGTLSQSSSATIVTDYFPAPAYTVSVSPITSVPAPPLVTGYPSSSSTNEVSPVTNSGSSALPSGFTTKPYATNTPYAVPSYGYSPGGYSALPYSHDGHRGEAHHDQGQSESWWGSWFGQGNH